MPQKRTPLLPESYYHIWTHANGDDNLFRCDDNYRYFLRKYIHHLHPVVETYAYCLMPNHLHLMVRVREERQILEFLRIKKSTPTLQEFETLGGLGKVISQQFSNLFNGYTQAFNKMYNRKGSLFIPNFNRKLIDSDQYFVQLIAYIHNNPVHHGFTQTPNEWTYSSWHAYLSNKVTRIKKEKRKQWFGDLENFKVAHHELNMAKSAELFEN